MKRLGAYFILILTCINIFGQDNKKGNKNVSLVNGGKIWEISPGQDYSAVLSSLQPGDQLALHEGSYEGTIVVNVSGLPDKPIIIRGFGNGEKRPVLIYNGNGANLLQINGDNLIFDYLEFRSRNTYSLRIGTKENGNDNITVKNCLFYECGGGSLSANAPAASYNNIYVTDNYFIGAKRTPVYIGDHSGKGAITNFNFKGNVIDGSQNDGPAETIGYGIELKLNVIKSTVENNFIAGTKGPGIMVYGATSSDPANANIVKNNIVVGARNSAGIVVGGGPSVVRDNVVFRSNTGIGVENYAGRNLLNNIVLSGNTTILNNNTNMAFGKSPGVTATGNLSIAAAGSKDFTGNLNNDGHNNTLSSSKSLEKHVSRIVNMTPEKNNLNKIWLLLSSHHPLDKKEIIKLINLLAEYKIPAKVSR